MLQHLDVSSCEIMEIEDDAMGRLEILVTLHLSHNHLARVPTSLPTSLVNLYLQHNQITDIQPNAFAQMTNLEVLNLAGNKLTYLPGLPLPKLVTLNVRAAGLKGLSQSVVKSSPNIKDLLLDGNPIKCSELLGIAEWATPCRSEKTFELVDIDSQAQRIAGEAIDQIFQSFRTRYHCARASLSHFEKPVCAHEKLISSTVNQLSYKSNETVVPTNANTNTNVNANANTNTNTNSTTVTITNSSGVTSDNRTVAIPHHPFENKTVESTSKDSISGRKLSGKEITLANKSMGLNENIPAEMWPGASIDANGESNITGHLTENDVKSNNQDNKIPPLSIPERRRNEAKMLTATTNANANANAGETKILPSHKVTKSGKNATLRTTATAPADKQWKNIEIGYNKKSEVLPNRQKYFTNRTRGAGGGAGGGGGGKTKLVAASGPGATGTGMGMTVKTTNYLHKTMNQTFYTDNKNVFKAKTTLFSATNKFNENRTINSGSGSGFSSGRDKTPPPAADNVRSATQALGNDANSASELLSVAGLNRKGVVSGGGRLWTSVNGNKKKNTSNGEKVSVIKDDGRTGTGTGTVVGTAVPVAPQISEQTPASTAAVSGSSDMDVYQRDEEHAGPKAMLPTTAVADNSKDTNEKSRPHESDKPNAGHRDKLDHLAESLAQMMTVQKDNNVLTQTGLPNAKLDIMADVTPLSKQKSNGQQQTTKQQQQQQRQTQQPGTNGGHYKNDTINWTTNKAISHENNANGNRKREQEAGEPGSGDSSIGSNGSSIGGSGGSNITMAKVLQRVQTVDPANKFAVRTMAVAPRMIIKSNQSGSGGISADNQRSRTTEMASDGADQGSRQPLRPGISADANDHSGGNINGNDKNLSSDKIWDASSRQPSLEPFPITDSPKADDNKTINNAPNLGPTHNTKHHSSDISKSNENKLNERRNMKIKINRNAGNGQDSVATAAGGGAAIGTTTGAVKPNVLNKNKNCINGVDGADGADGNNGGNAGNAECENNIYTAENPLNTQANNDDSVSVPAAKHNTLNKDKLINNIVAENYIVVEKDEVFESHMPAVSSTAIHSDHHGPSVNVARRKGNPLTENAEPQSSETATATSPLQQQQQQHSEDDHTKEPNSNANNGGQGNNSISNTSASSGRPEQWNDVRTATSHPGLFVVIGVTIGMVVSLGLIHLYRCRKPWHRHRNSYPDDDQEQYTPAHRDLLPMEILNSSSIHYTDAPIDLW